MLKISQCHKDMMLGLGENVLMYFDVEFNMKYFSSPLRTFYLSPEKKCMTFKF